METTTKAAELRKGRELDADIAERVFGYTIIYRDEAIRRSNETVRDGGVRFDHWYTEGLYLLDKRFTPTGFENLPYYSVDADAASQVEDEIERRGLRMQYVDALCQQVGGKLLTTSWGELAIEDFFPLIHATPEQRCIAALKAISRGS